MRLWCDVPGGEGPYAGFPERISSHPEYSFLEKTPPDAEIPPTRERIGIPFLQSMQPLLNMHCLECPRTFAAV